MSTDSHNAGGSAPSSAPASSGGDGVRVDVLPGGWGRITLCRPERHNAFDDALIAQLSTAITTLGADPSVRLVLLESSGASFSAGADLQWMKRMATYSPEQNRADALALARMLEQLHNCPKPTMALVQGPAYGGGVGLVAACDIVIAVDSAQFAFTEVRIGLTPATISPYVIRAIGARAALRWFTSAERFSAAQALEMGLVHQVVAADQLITARDKQLAAIAQGSAQAQADCKRLVRHVQAAQWGEALQAFTAEEIARARASAQGREGVAAFLDKRQPAWRGDFQ